MDFLNVFVVFLCILAVCVLGFGLYKYNKSKPKDPVSTIMGFISTLTEFTNHANELQAFKANDGVEAYKKTLADYVSNYIIEEVTNDDKLSDLSTALAPLINAGVINKESLSLAILTIYNTVDDLSGLIKEKYDEANQPDDDNEKHVDNTEE